MRAKFPLWARNTKHARFLSHLHESNITGCALHRPGGRGGPPENCRNPEQIFWHTDQLRVTSFMPHVPKIFVIFNQPPAAVSCSSSWNERGNLSKYLSNNKKHEINIFSLCWTTFLIVTTVMSSDILWIIAKRRPKVQWVKWVSSF